MAAALAAMAAELATIWQQKAGHNFLAVDSWPKWQQKACHDDGRKLAVMADSGRKPVATVASLS